MIILEHVHQYLKNIWPYFTLKVIIELLHFWLLENRTKNLLLVCHFVITRDKTEVNIWLDPFFEPVQYFYQLVCLVVSIFIVRVLW